MDSPLRVCREGQSSMAGSHMLCARHALLLASEAKVNTDRQGRVAGIENP